MTTVFVTHPSAAVSEWIIAVMVDLARGISRYATAYHRDQRPVPVMGRELRGATVGVIGFGQIGRYRWGHTIDTDDLA